MDTITYKGVLCRLGTYRVKGENRPALFCIDARNDWTVYDAGFEEVHMAGPWVKILTDDEYEEIMKTMTTSRKMAEMFRGFQFNEKPDNMISEVNGHALPEDYLAFMSRHNGGEGPLGENNYGRFYRIEELQEVNDDYEVEKWWPGYVVFGTDGGGELWAYNPEKKVYCQIDSCNIDDDTYDTLSESLEEFLIRMDEEGESYDNTFI